MVLYVTLRDVSPPPQDDLTVHSINDSNPLVEVTPTEQQLDTDTSSDHIFYDPQTQGIASAHVDIHVHVHVKAYNTVLCYTHTHTHTHTHTCTYTYRISLIRSPLKIDACLFKCRGTCTCTSAEVCRGM